MDYKATTILILACLTTYSFSSPPDTSPYSPDPYSAFSYKSSLASIFSMLADKDGEMTQDLTRTPHLFLLSRLLSKASADQQGAAGMDPTLLSLKELLADLEKQMARLDEEVLRRSAMRAGLWDAEMGFGEQMLKEKTEKEEKKEEERGIEEERKETEKNTGPRDTEPRDEQRSEKLTEKITDIRRSSEIETQVGEKTKEIDDAEMEEEREKKQEKEEIERKMYGGEGREEQKEIKEKDHGEDGRMANREKEEVERNVEKRVMEKANNDEGEEEEGRKEDKAQGKIGSKGGLSQMRRQRKTESKQKNKSHQHENASNEEDGDKRPTLFPPLPDIDEIINQIKEKIQEIIENIKLTVNTGFHHILHYYIPSNASDISDECAIDVSDGSFLAPANSFWFLRLLDSWGKFPDGFFWGNIHTMGMYQECITTEASTVVENGTRTYKGRYCAVTYKPNRTRGGQEEEEGRGGRALLPSVRSGVSLATLASPLPFAYGTCIPSTCTEEDLEVSLADVMEQDGMEVAGVYCQTEEREDTELIPEDKAFLSIMAIFVILALLATIYEVVVITRKIGSFEAVLNFSLLRNMGRVFNYKNKKETGDVITCLAMMRVVTMLWIIIGHQYETNATFIANTFDSLTYQEPFFAQIVTNGWLSVDTFFFMTGLIFAFRLIPYMRRESGLLYNAKILLTVMVRRVVRLAPVILVVALFCASILRFLARGPNARVLESYSQDMCLKHWWKDPLFINNYVYPDNEGSDVNDCLSHCWYTAVDVQLLLLLPVIFLSAVFNNLLGVAVMLTLTVASIVIPLAITLAYDLPPSPLHHVLGEKHLEYTTHIFMAPWCRMAPWLIGIWTGILLRTNKARTVKLSKLVVFLGYVVAIAIGLTLVMGLLDFNRLHFSLELVDKRWQDYPGVAAVYGCLSRPSWAVCLAWVVFTCHTGNAEMVNKIMSWPGWLPVARLTFIIYVVAPVVQIWWAAQLLVPTYFNYVGKLFECTGTFAISLLFAVILTCFIELPLVSTFNLLLPSPAKKHERVVRATKDINILNDTSNVREGWTDLKDGNKIFPL